MAVSGRKLVIFDGECGVCVRVISHLQQKDGRGRLAFLPYQSTELSKLSPGLTANKASRALYVVSPNGRRHSGARGMFAMMRELTGFWGWFGSVWFSLPLSLLAEPFYRLFAGNRRRISRWLGLAECPIPRRIGGGWDESGAERK